jgi:hypothetical protein
MTQADRVLSAPPTNTLTSRRAVIAVGIAAAAAPGTAIVTTAKAIALPLDDSELL